MFYEVGISYVEEIEDSKGNLKERKKTEKFLVKSESITAAESKVKDKIKNIYQEFTVKYIKESPILSVFE
jgi:hypothetical protein